MAKAFSSSLHDASHSDFHDPPRFWPAGGAPLEPKIVQADGWLSHPKSEWYELMEDSVLFRDGSILSLLWWKNEKQIIDLMDQD